MATRTQPYPDLLLDAGTTFELEVAYYLPDDGSGIPTSAFVAGDTVVVKFKAHPNAASASVTKVIDPDVDEGTFEVHLTSEEVRSLGTQGVWGMDVVAAGGEPQTRLMQGKYGVQGWDVTP